MLEDGHSIVALRQALRMYLFIGVVLVAVGVRTWQPSAEASWPECAIWVISEVLFWPKVLPELARQHVTVLIV